MIFFEKKLRFHDFLVKMNLKNPKLPSKSAIFGPKKWNNEKKMDGCTGF